MPKKIFSPTEKQAKKEAVKIARRNMRIIKEISDAPSLSPRERKAIVRLLTLTHLHGQGFTRFTIADLP